MITRIEVDGFKSLRGFALEFEPLTAVIGANGAGKSNLFDVLRLLSLLPRMSVTEAFKSLRGHIRDQFSQTQDGPGESMTITTDWLLHGEQIHYGDPNRWRHVIRIERVKTHSSITEALEITSERLSNIHLSEDSWMTRHPDLLHLAPQFGGAMTIERLLSPIIPTRSRDNGAFLHREAVAYLGLPKKRPTFASYTPTRANCVSPVNVVPGPRLCPMGPICRPL